MPLLTVVGGPNGSGKSTFTRGLVFEGRDNLLDPDAIAIRMSPANLLLAAVSADIRRRYERSLGNLPAALRLADEAIVYDNTGSAPRRVLYAKEGIVMWFAQDEPAWVTRVRDEMSAADKDSE